LKIGSTLTKLCRLKLNLKLYKSNSYFYFFSSLLSTRQDFCGFPFQLSPCGILHISLQLQRGESSLCQFL